MEMLNMPAHELCLNMIVKNEAPVIRRCLESVLPLIDTWVIVDTGSTDGTQDIIRAFFSEHGLPGELHERPWKDFAHNRSEALTLARPRAEYSLIIDADDALEIPAGFAMPPLVDDCYMVEIGYSNLKYERVQIVANRLPWCYRGVLHEFPAADGHLTTGQIGLRMRVNHDGARRRDPLTYRKDASILEAALASETDPFLRARYTFYLAQSYRDCREPELSLKLYLQRADQGFWEAEVFISLYEAAKIKEQLGYPDQDVIDAYLVASKAMPSRAEALHGASRFCRNKGRNQEGYEIARRGIDLGMPVSSLFVEPWIYQYGILDEYSVNAYWSGRYHECLVASLRILESPAVPQDMRSRVLENAKFAAEKLAGEAQFQGPRSDSTLAVESSSREEWLVKAREPGYEPNWTTPVQASPLEREPLVSVVTPTHDRAHFLARTRRYFESQDYSNIEWLILDDGSVPDANFEMPAANVRYFHMKERLSIGAKRNWLVEHARGEIIVHFDDDDYYAPGYVRRMIEELEGRKADLLNLRGWWMYDLRTNALAYWDLRHSDGPHFQCDSSGVSLVDISGEGKVRIRDNEYGFGFTFAYRKVVWEKHRFPDINWNEDGEFSRAARRDFVVDGFPDTGGLTLHYLHANSTSRCFPQFLAPEFLLDTLFRSARESTSVQHV